MKKFIAVLLALAMLFTLSACAGSTNGTTPAGTKDSASTKNDTKTPEKIKIGYTFWNGTAHGLMGDAANMIKIVEEALGIEVLFNTSNDTTADGVITSVQNLISAGCQGVVCCNFAESSMVNIGKICKDSNVYFAQFYRTLSDEDVISALKDNEYYVGRVHEDEYSSAYNLAKALADAGCKNVAMISSVHGDNTYETRAAGYRQACEDLGVNIVVEEWDVSMDANCTTTATNILSAYPEVDGFLLINCSYAPYVISAQQNLGTELLPMVGVDFDTSLEQYILDGAMTAIAGGHHNDPIFAILLVYNAICGAYDSKDYPIDIMNNLITINGAEEYNDYCDYFIGWEKDPETRQAYTVEEIQQLTITYNPNHTWQDIANAAAALSIQDVMTRHADLYKD